MSYEHRFELCSLIWDIYLSIYISIPIYRYRYRYRYRESAPAFKQTNKQKSCLRLFLIKGEWEIAGADLSSTFRLQTNLLSHSKPDYPVS